MKKYDHVYANGCSFTADNYQRFNNQPVYVDVLAEKLGATSTNSGIPGSCNRRIIRSTLRDSYSMPDDTLVVIQLTDTKRTERASTREGHNDWKFSHQDYKESVKPCLTFKLTGDYNDAMYPVNVKYSRLFLKHYDEVAELTDLITDVLMLTAHLRSQGRDYIIFPFMPLLTLDTAIAQIPVFSSNILNQEINKDPRVLNLATDSLVQRMGLGDYYYDADGTSGRVGHMNTNGVNRAADVLIELINSLN